MLETVPQSLQWAHPLVRDWFVGRFGSPTEPQVEGWPRIVRGESVLISAPTGSGKTLSAFLACLDRLVRQAVDGKLRDRTEVVYVSPLKALSNDIQKNLDGPLTEIQALAESRGIDMTGIRTAVRTGDTSQYERQKMLKKPPHILVTTPESLYILLTAEKGRKMLSAVETVIVDEIHAMADDKRGTHLSLTLERLDALALSTRGGRRPIRVGLSATQKPIEDIAAFLAGNERPLPSVIDVGSRRKLDVSIEVPGSPLSSVATHEMWNEIYDRIVDLVNEHRSTLVFVNTRRLAERVAHMLTEKLGEEAVGAHHGSLAKELRLTAEQKLKAGDYKVLVATASLELGIDIGDVDLVCHIGSPRSIAVSLQRIGRAGHWRGAIPKGRIFVTTRDELVECAALVRAIYGGDLDRVEIPEKPIDILAQQIVATCATGDWLEEDLFQLVRRAYPYRELAREEFDAVVEMLSAGIAGSKYRYGRYLHRDMINGRVRGRRGARLVAITNGGAIPETNLFTVVAEPDDIKVGTLDEDFAVESNRGDIILLGNSSWIVQRVEAKANVVRVVDAKGAPPSVPFWRGEAPARTLELSMYVSDLREEINQILDGETASSNEKKKLCVELLMDQCGLDRRGAEQLVEYIVEGRAILGTVPTQKRVIAERFFDESGGMQLVIHAPFGGRINKAWGLALRKRFCRSFNLELQAAATDDGINISLTDQHSFPLADVFQFLSTATIRDVLEQTALVSPFFAVRWRWDANRALALLRFQAGKKVPPFLQRMRAEDLLAAVFPDAAACQDNIVGKIEIPDHPLVNEVMKDVLTEALDIEGVTKVLNDIAGGEIECVAIDTPQPSAFCHEILNANPYAYLDDAPLEERRARAVEMRRVLPDKLVREIGTLDQESIRKVVLEAIPDIRDRDELHDTLMSVVLLPEDYTWANGETSARMWGGYFDVLEAEGRARRILRNGSDCWVAEERNQMFGALAGSGPESEEALDQLAAGWVRHTGPVTSSRLSEDLGVAREVFDLALIRLETRGLVLRGRYTDAGEQSEEWCERVLLSRIHRDTITELRKKIKPVTKAEFMNWLFSWQHIYPGSQLLGERGLLEALRQLGGFEAAANSWETSILRQRVIGYKPEYLDNLTLKGLVGWGRLSLHPAVAAGGEETGDKRRRRITPNSASPIAFYHREDTDWTYFRQDRVNPDCLSTPARAVFDRLSRRGASFFIDVVRDTKLLKAEVETALWELVTAGLATADSFDNLRSLIDPKRRAGRGRRGSTSRPRDSQGRWSLLDAPYNIEEDESSTEALEAVCWVLLRRYGIVFRDLLVRESNVPKWRELQTMYRRLEAKGQIRGGRFVSGFIGEQFALPEAVESLRLHKSTDRTPRLVKISAQDPLNLVGILVPGERVSSGSSKKMVFEKGSFIELVDY